MMRIFVKRCAGIILAAIAALSVLTAAPAVTSAETSCRTAFTSASVTPAAPAIIDSAITGSAITDSAIADSVITDSAITGSAVTDSEMRPSELYARYAVLMDADTGRVLYSKSGDTEAPMASTTKIMTCILALEYGDLSGEASASSNAVSQPEVKLGMREGQRFFLKDLLYSLMLESHNDTAVAIAEQIGGSTEGFADLMNSKAEELGCTSTYFITPNGLDAEDENGVHHTTARDLARIMKYCITESPAKDQFLEITQTDAYSFSDCVGNSTYTCTNHNAFLKMMDGALTGKTGFTADAGYCYVGALQNDGRTFIVALLACGWPNNKGYKWSDARKLMTYAIENYSYREIDPAFGQDLAALTINVKNGYTGGFPLDAPVKTGLTSRGDPVRILLKHDEKIENEVQLMDNICAPLQKGQQIGEITYSVNGSRIASYPLYAEKTVAERTFNVCLYYIRDLFFL